MTKLKEETLLDMLKEEETVLEIQNLDREIEAIKQEGEAKPAERAKLTKEELFEMDRRHELREKALKELKEYDPTIEEGYAFQLATVFAIDGGVSLERMNKAHAKKLRLESTLKKKSKH